MKTISQHVEDYMREYPFLSKFLRQGVVNYRALARKIEPEISTKAAQKVSIASIAVSLQRLHHRDKNKIFSMIGRLRGVVVVSDIYAFTVPEDPAAYTIARQLIGEGVGIQNPFCVVIRGHTETTYLIEEALAEKFLEMMRTKVRTQRKSLVALVITRELVHKTEVGSLSYPLQVLAEHGVLVRYVAATQNEELIIIDDEAADRAASILRQAMER
jgi:hypothetical protein